MNAFESITHARVTDCFEAEDSINFIVQSGQLGRALGKGGATISNARKKLGKRITVFEDSDDPREFIEKACAPAKASPMITEDYVKVDLPRSQRENIGGRQIRIIKEAIKRKLGVSKVDFSFI